MDRMERREERRARKLARRGARRRAQNQGSALAGILLLIVGGALILRELGYPLPRWLFTWPMILIIVGFFIGAMNRFRDLGWLILCAVGFFFLADRIWPGFEFRDFVIPAAIILVGLLLLLRPRLGGNQPFCRVHGRRWEEGEDEDNFEPPHVAAAASAKGNKEDILDVAAVFGAVKKNLYSKTFKGGEIVSVFGGVDLDLSQADFEGKIVIESVNIFGGATLIVPPTWQVRSEAVAIFGGIEDKRKRFEAQSPEKILVLEGFVMFGGIEIKSY
jgi:predicted membrane protein